ncbi:DUF4376 domain-containing protein [Undibacterium sp. TJN25]|uniref:DUF4376 domain-containing protein n=1 Tax=Undibacterium sp. TJN25 TaxID=3413056 RepID=UPI003BF3F2E3
MITDKLTNTIQTFGVAEIQRDFYLCDGALYPVANFNAFNVDIPDWAALGKTTYAKGMFADPLPTPAELADAKAAKNAEINIWREAANNSSFQFEGKAFSADALSFKDIMSFNGAVLLCGDIPPGWIGQWKAVDNSFIPIPDRATWTAFYLAMINQGQGNFLHSEELKETLANAATLQQIADIAW